MASFQDLPHEIVQLIGSFLSPASLHNFSLVNSLCCAVADPGIFQHIHLILLKRKTLIEELHRWDQILHQSPRKASKHLRRLTISCPCYPRGWTDFGSWVEINSWHDESYSECFPDMAFIDDFYSDLNGSTRLTPAILDQAGQARTRLEKKDKEWLCRERFAYIRQSLVNYAIDASLATSIFKIIARNPFTGWYSAYRDVTVYVHTCRTRKSGLGDPGYASYFTVLHYLSRRSWKCTRGEGYDEVVVDEIDVYSYPSLSESEIEDLEDPAGLFRSIWPERRGKNCLEDWYSLPLDVDA